MEGNIKFPYRIQLKLDVSFRFPLLLLFCRLSTVFLNEFEIYETIARKFLRFCFKFSKAKIHSPIVSELFSTFEDFVGTLDADGREYYIMGDFNCNMLPASFYNANTQALLNITDIYNLKQLITEPTRITPLSRALIDVIFTNLPDNFTCSGVSHIGISDHGLTYVDRKISSPPVIKGTSTITYRQFKNFNRHSFRSDILAQPWDDLKP